MWRWPLVRLQSRQRTSSLPTRELGKIGVQLPILGFGTAHAGLRLSTREAVDLYETAFRNGITYFDTAPEFAGYGNAQAQLKYFLTHVRSQVFLVTKCYEPDGQRALKQCPAVFRRPAYLQF
jgi:uncharacterized protein